MIFTVIMSFLVIFVVLMMNSIQFDFQDEGCLEEISEDEFKDKNFSIHNKIINEIENEKFISCIHENYFPNNFHDNQGSYQSLVNSSNKETNTDSN